MYGKRKSGVFFAVRVGFQVCFLEISQRRHIGYVITTSNVQVTITMTCLNFAVTGSRILLHPLSSSHRGKLSRKIALNSNGEVNYRELARRPCVIPTQLVHHVDTNNVNIVISHLTAHNWQK